MMAEGFEAYHVPQQSRRDKLRVGGGGCALNPHPGAGFLPLPSDLLTCAEPPFLPNHHEPLSLSLFSPVQQFRITTGSTSSSVPLGPFTGYATVLKGSRFLRPAQQLLEELCDVAFGGACDVAAEEGDVDLGRVGDVAGEECGRGKKSSVLVSMLDEVYKRYKYYHQQMQSVVASFESVAGLSNAAPFANLALKTMSKHFKNLKNAIMDQLQFPNGAQNNHKVDNSATFGNSNNGIIRFSQRPVQEHENQPVWRPQRGLPERAVTVLRAWLFDHFLHPYPTDIDKMMLAKQTGLSRNQVSNWFINARVRLWKPMVEEIHNLETRQAQNSSQTNHERNADNVSENFPTITSLISENPSTFPSSTLELPYKRAKNEFCSITNNGTEQPMCSYYEDIPQLPLVGGGMGNVSLTLGLHQNHGIGISEPFPMNTARRFGIDVNTQGYVFGNYEAENREFGRNFIGGQPFHDFVG